MISTADEESSDDEDDEDDEGDEDDDGEKKPEGGDETKQQRDGWMMNDGFEEAGKWPVCLHYFYEPTSSHARQLAGVSLEGLSV